MSEIKLVVGLGNPGKQYAPTRHNIGRRIIEALEPLQIPRIHLLIPDSYMNASGGPVAEAARRKGCTPQQILVISDDFMIALGTFRIRRGGSSGGHNGLKSIFQTLGTEEIPRLRVGVGPVPEHADPKDFVLQPFRKDERDLVEKVIATSVDVVQKIVESGIEGAMNEYNGKKVEG